MIYKKILPKEKLWKNEFFIKEKIWLDMYYFKDTLDIKINIYNTCLVKLERQLLKMLILSKKRAREVMLRCFNAS